MAKEKIKRKPTLLEALSVLVFMIVVFSGGVLLGMNYVPLVALVAAYAYIIAIRCGYTFNEVQAAVNAKISKAIPIMSIFLGVGVLLGALVYCGTVPMIIYYGTKIISVKWVYLCAFILCAIFSSLTGTANGSVTTAGLAMMGIGAAMEGCNLPILCGAILGGATFGDKLSPLSDTTIMAAAVTDNDVYAHMKHQFKVVGPATVITLAIYIVIGLTSHGTGMATSESTVALQESLKMLYKFSPLLLIPIIPILVGAFKKWPSAPTMLLAGLLGIIIGWLYQGCSITDGVKVIYEGFKLKMLPAYVALEDTSVIAKAATTLCERGGMTSMIKPFLTAFICYHFAGAAQCAGTLEVIINAMAKFTKNRLSLILTSGVSMIVLEMLCGSSTPAASLAGPLFKDRYEDMDLHSLNLARELEDFGTGSTAFIPWSSTGTLYISTLTYGTFVPSAMTFLSTCYLSWFIYIIALFYAITGFNVMKKDGTMIRSFGKKKSA